MTELAFSTLICDVPAPPTVIANHWLARRKDHPAAAAIDGRIPLPVAREVGHLLKQQDVETLELSHAEWGPRGSRLPRIAADDRNESHAAAAALEASVALAAELGARRVVVRPVQLELSISVAELIDPFSRGLSPAWEALTTSRSHVVDAHLDGLRRVLDSVAAFAATCEVTIAIMHPVIWPHQLPNASEWEALTSEFAGAPLTTMVATDHEHARAVIHDQVQPVVADPFDAWTAFSGVVLIGAEPEASPPPEKPARPLLRLADAAGLSLRLPLGCGEVDLRGALDPMPNAITVAFDAHAQTTEIERSFGWIEKECLPQED